MYVVKRKRITKGTNQRSFMFHEEYMRSETNCYKNAANIFNYLKTTKTKITCAYSNM